MVVLFADTEAMLGECELCRALVDVLCVQGIQG